MFGYVLPLSCRLGEEERKRYRAAYCGLCRSLKERYGFRSRFLVNYDMTFLYFLLKEEREEGTESCSCPARPFCKRNCMPNDAAMAYGADLTVLLSVWKLRDGAEDGGFFRKLLNEAALLLYRKAYARAAALRQEENALFDRQLASLRQLEREHCPSIDRAADTFASLLRGCIPGTVSGEKRRILEHLLYHVGRYLYLTDALEDLPGDRKRGGYNPLLYRYSLAEGDLTPEDRDSLANTIEASIDLAASGLELLPKGPNSKILENIIYDGLPAVLKSVCNGSFRKRRRNHEGPL